MEGGSKMTREEQIENFANSQVDCEFFDERLYKGIIIGAKWADEHPNKDLKKLIRKAESYDKLVSKGLVSIERVCEWLSDNMKNYAAFDSDMIKDLKKAIEE